MHPLIFAQAAAPASDPILTLVNLGIAGVVIVALLTGKLWPQPGVRKLEEQVDYERAQREKAEAQRDRLIATYEDRVLPVLAEVVPAVEKLLEAADTMARRSDRDGP